MPSQQPNEHETFHAYERFTSVRVEVSIVVQNIERFELVAERGRTTDEKFIESLWGCELIERAL